MKQTKNLLIGGALMIIVVIALVVGFRGKKTVPNGETVKIGAALALTGDASAWGEMEKKGIELRLGELENGMIDGKKVEVIYEDTHSTSAGTIAAAQKLISIDGVKYLIGPTWLDSYPGIQGIIKDKDVLVITPSASATAIQQPDKVENLFSAWYRTDALTDGLAEYVSSQNHKNVAIVFQNDAYYADFIHFFTEAARAQGIEIVSTDMLNPGQSDTKTILAKLKSHNVDAILFGAYDESLLTNFLQDKKNILPSVAVYSNDAIRGYIGDSQYAKLLEGIIFVENSVPAPDFTKKFSEAYGEQPNPSASTAYDTAGIFITLIDKESTVSGMISRLAKDVFETQSYGSITFDGSNGVVSENKQYQVQKITNGEVVQIR